MRIGPGAARLSPEIKAIHLEFAAKFNNGHFGARKVWRNYLPRLKYHNPAVAMTVSRHNDQEGPSELTVYYATPPENPTARSPSITVDNSMQGRRDIIDMRHKHESEILNQFMELTTAVPYKASSSELAEMEEVAEDNRRRQRDRERQTQLNETKKHEQNLLEQARGSTS